MYSNPLQSKKANFDASHELEELLLEDNPLKAKQRKANQENFSPEMKQMEDQWVYFSANHTDKTRFTIYDFKKMQRRSYYPQNQVTTMTATSSSGVIPSRPVTPSTNANDNVTVHGQGHSMNGEHYAMSEKAYAERD